MGKSLCVFLILFFNVSNSSSQNPINKLYQGSDEGLLVEKRLDGSTLCKHTIKNGNIHGSRDCYHKNGAMWVHESFDDGKYNGTNYSLTELGDTVFIEIYQHDTLFYTRNFDYYKNGSLKSISTINYINDSTLKVNPFKTRKFFRGTTINIRHTERTISNSGWFVQFREDGTVSDSVEISNGEYTGRHLVFYESGEVEIDAEIVDFKYDGKYLLYDKSGNIIEERNYTNGKLVK